MREERYYVFTAGTIGAFLFFIIALIATGLRYAMSLIRTVIAVAMVIEGIIGAIFILLIIAGQYSRHKTLGSIFTVIGTAGMIAATKFVGTGLSAQCSNNPGFGDLIMFAISALIVGVPWYFSCLGWFWSAVGAKEGDPEDMLKCFGVEVLGVVVLYLMVYVW